jgi:hypothetical protein
MPHVLNMPFLLSLKNTILQPVLVVLSLGYGENVKNS